MSTGDQGTHDKQTRRLNPADTATQLRDKYTRRIKAIKSFTERIQKTGMVDEAELETLRAVGVSEAEIKALVEEYRG